MIRRKEMKTMTNAIEFIKENVKELTVIFAKDHIIENDIDKYWTIDESEMTYTFKINGKYWYTFSKKRIENMNPGDLTELVVLFYNSIIMLYKVCIMKI